MTLGLLAVPAEDDAMLLEIVLAVRWVGEEVRTTKHQTNQIIRVKITLLILLRLKLVVAWCLNTISTPTVD